MKNYNLCIYIRFFMDVTYIQFWLLFHLAMLRGLLLLLFYFFLYFYIWIFIYYFNLHLSRGLFYFLYIFFWFMIANLDGLSVWMKVKHSSFLNFFNNFYLHYIFSASFSFILAKIWFSFSFVGTVSLSFSS